MQELDPNKLLSDGGQKMSKTVLATQVRVKSKNLISFLKKIFTRNNFLFVFLTSLFSFFLIFLVGFGLVWNFRSELFGYFAKEYFKNVQSQNEKIGDNTEVATEKIIEEQPTESAKTIDKIIRPYLGVRYVVINSEIKEKNNLSVDYGVLVKAGANKNEPAIIPGSPADKAGIVENDIILLIDGIKLDDKTNLASIIREKSVGQVINLKILRRGEEKNISAILESAKDS